MKKKIDTRIIAEIGINHNGQIDIARELISDAKKTSCWGVKFQYRNLERSYVSSANELGDEILSSEIEKNYISPSSILELKAYAKSLDIKVGISFFTLDDVEDFSRLDFDFYKVPSSEMLNIDLIKYLIKTKKPVLISTGMHDEDELELLYSEIAHFENWTPLYCVSNYPTRAHNVNLATINGITKKSKRLCGYSSHDDSLGVIFAALSMGLPYFERHITLDKNGTGLDHSSSSTLVEFQFFADFLDHINSSSKEEAKFINQGELINRQNLGRSWYAKKEVKLGELLDRKDFVYRSPQKGLNWYSANMAFSDNVALKKSISINDPLTERHLINKVIHKLSDDDLDFSLKYKIGIPVRPHDFRSLAQSIPCNNYEFHLSFKDVDLISSINLNKFPPNAVYSIHAPDYISSTALIDPFSIERAISHKSLVVFKTLIEFAKKLADHSGSDVPIVSSLSNPQNKLNYYSDIYLLHKNLNYESLTFQWLPPFAWYFGGSVKLNAFSSFRDIKDIATYNIPVTFDTSHFLLGKNYFKFGADKAIEDLSGNIRHIHMSDAVGYDGEGIQICPTSPNATFFNKVLDIDLRKILEIWQGHLDNGSEFIRAIKNLRAMRESIHG